MGDLVLGRGAGDPVGDPDARGQRGHGALGVARQQRDRQASGAEGGDGLGGVGAGLDLRLQFRRLIESDNGVALLEGATGPGAGRGFVAGGAEYQLNRRGLPSLTAALLLGSGPSGFVPGVRASASGEVARFSYRAEVAAEPYRATAPPYRANVAVGTALGPGALGLELGAALANDFGVPPVLLRGSYAFRF